jgi:TetR/AcrR family transcriptional regulator, transcriptional repressor for nem operon
MSKAANTRHTILQKSFELVYKNGYRTTSIDDIIATTQVTKGAFFYHFKNKDDMGLAMIEEVMHPGLYSVLITPLLNTTNPIDELYTMMSDLLLKSPFMEAKYGCPAVNLIEEMSPINQNFNKALTKLMLQWQQAIETTINNGKATKKINPDVNAKQVAYFIISGYGGIRNMGKMLGKACYTVYLKEFKNYLAQLA